MMDAYVYVWWSRYMCVHIRECSGNVFYRLDVFGMYNRYYRFYQILLLLEVDGLFVLLILIILLFLLFPAAATEHVGGRVLGPSPGRPRPIGVVLRSL